MKKLAKAKDNKIVKSLGYLIQKEKREHKYPISVARSIDHINIKRIIGEYNKQLYVKKLNINEINTFLKNTANPNTNN